MTNTLTTFHPNSRIPSLLGGRVFDDFFDNFFSDLPAHIQRSTQGYPIADIYKSDGGETMMEFALAGFGKDDLSIAIQPEKRSITVAASAAAEDATNEDSSRRIARRNFSKTYVNYDSNLDLTKAEANFVNGLLTVRVPTRAEVKPVEIKIQ
tara:strand:+ start:770 stop:1225 length:456 start_codon:yes stop_codon:yes gene_type:complete